MRVRRVIVSAVVLAVLLPAPELQAVPQVPCVNGHAIRTTDDLLRLNKCQLEALYRNAPPAPVPQGFVPGRALPAPGGWFNALRSRLIHLLWQGKVFLCNGVMINRALGRNMVTASVEQGPSWLDGRPSLILDYQGHSQLFGNVRDEIREVAPGLYLGITYIRRCPEAQQSMWFGLDARTLDCQSQRCR